ncbi:hypothetical protein FA13DRAFT_1789169 [Coprinellus micaceus]|uniref:Uncharacterized protein n=1 Tax=Coprinellus micaceus TaxID=71717 RepID=A0A4Y7TLF4_COPMI|nr:hypothetical protein FA13DRAFT_1789169 [Coprinellus micaceus]
MSGSSSCASSTASTPTRLNKPLPKATKLTIKIPTVPVMVTASPLSPSWRVIEPRPQDEDEFRPPGLMCYPSAPSKARGVHGPTQPRQPLASVTRPNGVVDPDIAHSSRDKDEVQSGIPGQIGKVSTSSRKGASRRKPYDPTGAPPPLKDALIVECAGDGQLDLVPINPTAPTSPRASIPSPPAPSNADVPLLSSVPLQIPRVHPPTPDLALAWASVPASLPIPVPSQATPLPFPRSYADLPQWQRISQLRNDYASNAFNAKAHSLEIHARDYRAGLLLLSLLDVLRDRQRYIDECRHDIRTDGM